MGKTELSQLMLRLVLKFCIKNLSHERKSRAHIYTNDPNTKKSSFSLDNSTTGMHFLEESTVLIRS